MEMKNQRKPMLYYWLIAVLVMGFINMFLLPFAAKNAVTQVGYDVFLSQMEEKNISQAEIKEDVIYFFLKEETVEETEILPSQPVKIYSTVKMDDPELVERLYEAGAAFGEVKPKEVSPFMSTFIMFAVFFLLWRFVMKKAFEKMGGMGKNAMSFGKAKANRHHLPGCCRTGRGKRGVERNC